MNHEDILKARKVYKRRQKEKAELTALKEELEKLEKSPDVQRYLELVSIGKRNVPTEEQIIRSSFSGISTDENDFRVYLYTGAFIRSWNHDERDSQIFDRSKADYLCYINIGDEWDIVNIKPTMQEQFERENTVLKPKSVVRAERTYYELQTIYYEYLLKGDLRQKRKILEKIKEHL